jgi:hypothetical protein
LGRRADIIPAGPRPAGPFLAGRRPAAHRPATPARGTARGVVTAPATRVTSRAHALIPPVLAVAVPAGSGMVPLVPYLLAARLVAEGWAAARAAAALEDAFYGAFAAIGLTSVQSLAPGRLS